MRQGGQLSPHLLFRLFPAILLPVFENPARRRDLFADSLERGGDFFLCPLEKEGQ
jgi:hypothetical protein